MKQNEIALPQERANTRSTWAEQEGFKGKTVFAVDYNGRNVMVRCADKAAALYLAAQKLGVRFKSAEYHQNAEVRECKWHRGI